MAHSTSLGNRKRDHTLIMVFLYPQLNKWDFLGIRFFGSGLGNLLLPWARAVSLANRYGLPVVFPTWPQVKIGTYLRREKDKRHYFGIFSPSSEYIVGWARLTRLLYCRWVGEEVFLARPDFFLRANQDHVVNITGCKDFFLPILEDHELIRMKLLDIIRPSHIPARTADRYVAVHIRLGDFKVGKQITPLDFFDNVLLQIKANLPHMEVFIFTDGRRDEIDHLLTKHQARLADFGSSMADLLAMSKSTLLVASKNSTFCWWASYLGRMPVIWPKDTSTFPIYRNKEIELYLDTNAIVPQEVFDGLIYASDGGLPEGQDFPGTIAFRKQKQTWPER